MALIAVFFAGLSLRKNRLRGSFRLHSPSERSEGLLDLRGNPGIGLLETGTQRTAWFPAQLLLDEPIIGVAAANAQRP
jgi:hypothetical protein